MTLPLDHPSLRRHPRIYFALTNHCNRSCPWCSVYSSPQKSTFLSPERFTALLPSSGAFAAQLEGGEPTVHPHFWDFIGILRAHPGSREIILCTNGTRFPRSKSKLRAYLERLGRPVLIKMSVNHHLLEKDPGLFDLCSLLQETLTEIGAPDALVLNVRRRRDRAEGDRAIVEELEKRSLVRISNIFFLQRYGLASGEMGWDEPFAVQSDFIMVNPDGQIFNGDLIGRSEAMGTMP